MSVCLYIVEPNGNLLEVDISEDFPIRTSFVYSDYFSNNKRKSNQVEQIILVGTKKTNRALKHIYRFDSYTPDDRGNQYRVRLLDGGKDLFGGDAILTIEEIIIDPKQEYVEYDCSILGTNYLWSSILSNTPSCAVDLGSQPFSAANAQLSWDRYGTAGPVHDHTDGFVYVPIHYGQWGGIIGNNGVKEVRSDQLRPSIYVHKLIYDAFDQFTDFSIVSDFLETELFQGLILPFTGSEEGEDWFISQSAVELALFSCFAGPDTVVPLIAGFQFPITFDNEFFDNGNNFAGNTYTAPFTKTYTFVFEVSITGTVTGPAPIQCALINATTLLDYSGTSFAEIIIPAGTYFNEKFTFVIEDECINKGDRVVPRIRTTSTSFPSAGSVTINGGSSTTFSQVSTSTSTLCPGTVVEFGATLPCKMTIKDILDGLTHMFNLVWRTDVQDKIVYVEPDERYYDCEKALDYSHKLNCVEKVKITYLFEVLGNNILHRYQDDSKDHYVSDFTDSLDRTLYGKITRNEFSNRTIGELNEITNPLFAPTWYIADFDVVPNPGDPTPYWLRMWDSNEVQPTLNGTTQLSANSYSFKPRIAYYGGIQDYTAEAGQSVDFKFDGATVTGFPHAWIVNQYQSNTYSLSFGDGDEGSDTGLVFNYWKSFLNLYFKSRGITAEMIVTVDDILAMLRMPIYLSSNYLGQGNFKLNKVREHDARTGRAIVELLKLL
jgi:hypothetical protein